MAIEGFIITFLVIILALLIVLIASMWKVFNKAGQPGWTAIIPIYNLYILIKMACKPSWWLILFLIPLVNIIVHIIVINNISKNFGKGTGFTIGLILLPFIFYPILGFGDATYNKY